MLVPLHRNWITASVTTQFQKICIGGGLCGGVAVGVFWCRVGVLVGAVCVEAVLGLFGRAPRLAGLRVAQVLGVLLVELKWRRYL